MASRSAVGSVFPSRSVNAIATKTFFELTTELNRSFQYDFNGNRKIDSIRGNTSVINNVLTGDALSSYLPPGDGSGSIAAILDQASGSPKYFVYRVDGRLSQYSDSSISASYSFDALGRRIAKTIAQGSDSPFNQAYVYLADSNQVLLGQAGNGNTYLYLNGQGLNEHLGEMSSNGVKAYASDHLGSVLNGSAAGSAQAFGSFGENLGTAPALSASSNPTMYGYAGMQKDAESGQYNTTWRSFDPSNGRWSSKDPSGFQGGSTNLNSYALNNPIILIDPTGLDAVIYKTPAEGVPGLLGIEHTFVVVGQPGDALKARVEFGPMHPPTLYEKNGEVLFSSVTQSEIQGRVLQALKLDPLQDIEILIQAAKIRDMTEHGQYPYSAVPDLRSGNNCDTFANSLLKK